MLRFTSALLVASILLLSACGDNEPATSSRDNSATPIAVWTVERQELSRPLSLSATVQPYQHVHLASRTAAQVSEVAVREGDQVEQGELLARLDVSEARAELQRADAEARSAQLDFDRSKALRERGIATLEEFQRVELALDVARSQRALWQARVAYGEISAPISGTITARHIEPGEAVDQQQTLFELADLQQLVLRPGLSEQDIPLLSTGQTMPITLDALPELALDAELTRIFPAARGGNRLIEIELQLPEDSWQQGVRPGYLARINTRIDRRPDTLVVPAQAIATDADGDYVYLLTDDQLERRSISAGITRGRWREIKDGLSSGERILASNPLDMRSGEEVEVVSEYE
ncbi:MAG: efflux RND transporter periplasmic adaptor subunit [Pseudomonadaceae bacterium]|nr:MAG: efflux RND transporter periplasmic adaptor subunit [Pseudomonadaceae bacterium]